MNYQTNSAQGTLQLAKKLARNLPARIFSLEGELGSGKTTFVQGFAQGFGIKEKVISPTFVLIRQHKVPKTNLMLYHIDLYRIEQIGELGLKEILSNKNNIVLIEWAEKLKELPKGAIKISIKKTGQTKRVFTIAS